MAQFGELLSQQSKHILQFQTAISEFLWKQMPQIKIRFDLSDLQKPQQLFDKQWKLQALES